MPTARRPLVWTALVRGKTLAPKLLRVFAYLTVLGAVSGMLLVRSVWGSVTERSLTVGRQMKQFGDLLEGAHTIRLNGERVYLASRVTQQSIGEVLDRFEADCLAHDGGFEKAYGELPPAALAKLQNTPFWKHRLAISRQQTDDDGAVTCIAHAGDGGFLAAVRRLEQFVETGDAGRIGELRNVYVTKTKAGATHVLTTWTQGSFNVYKLLDKDGLGQDLPGSDPAFAPRPPESRRLFTAQIEGTPMMVVTYTTDLDERPLLAKYTEQLALAGWKRTFDAADLPGGVFERQGTTMVVGVRRDERLHKTVVSALQSFAVGARP